MFMSADIIVQGVMIGLFIASVVTWTVGLAKSLELIIANRRLREALRRISAEGSLLDALNRLEGSRGLARTMIETAVSEVRLSGSAPDPAGVKERVASHLTRIEAAASRAIARGTGVLATIGSTAPFVGLFGTVWGIMNSFIGISKAQTTNLAVVAPGIAEALLATAHRPCGGHSGRYHLQSVRALDLRLSGTGRRHLRARATLGLPRHGSGREPAARDQGSRVDPMAGRIDEGADELVESHEINVTPFIDVMLVLLIIFMVAAPLSTVDIHVDLPVSTAKPQPRPDKPLYLTIKSDLSLNIGNDSIPRAQLASAIEAATQADKASACSCAPTRPCRMAS